MSLSMPSRLPPAIRERLVLRPGLWRCKMRLLAAHLGAQFEKLQASLESSIARSMCRHLPVELEACRSLVGYSTDWANGSTPLLE
jgi:hypothetical protein